MYVVLRINYICSGDLSFISGKVGIKMLKTMYSGEKSAWVQKQVTLWRDHNGMKLYKLDVAMSYLWLEIEPGILVSAQFRDSDVQNLSRREGNTLPVDLEDWKKRVSEHFRKRFDNDGFLPPDALYLGFTQEQIDHGLRLAKIRSDVKAVEREASYARQREVAEAREVAVIVALKASVLEDKTIDAGQLIDLAKHLGIEIHSRTIGMLRKRVVSLNSSSARIRGKGLPSNSPYSLYKQCRNLLLEEKEVIA